MSQMFLACLMTSQMFMKAKKGSSIVNNTLRTSRGCAADGSFWFTDRPVWIDALLYWCVLISVDNSDEDCRFDTVSKNATAGRCQISCHADKLWDCQSWGLSFEEDQMGEPCCWWRTSLEEQELTSLLGDPLRSKKQDPRNKIQETSHVSLFGTPSKIASTSFKILVPWRCIS